MRVVEVTLKVYVIDSIVNQGADAVEAYLNDKLHTDPEFFGEIDQGCFTITDEFESEDIS